ncbi:hypothetical protein LB503_008117 [Fusarium chuoi]|nr:hypothetical protein LB503_008117 [Fusarium chuoi]
MPQVLPSIALDFIIIPEQKIPVLRSDMVTNSYAGYLLQGKNNVLTIDQCLPHSSRSFDTLTLRTLPGCRYLSSLQRIAD